MQLVIRVPQLAALTSTALSAICPWKRRTLAGCLGIPLYLIGPSAACADGFLEVTVIPASPMMFVCNARAGTPLLVLYSFLMKIILVAFIVSLIVSLPLMVLAAGFTMRMATCFTVLRIIHTALGIVLVSILVLRSCLLLVTIVCVHVLAHQFCTAAIPVHVLIHMAPGCTVQMCLIVCAVMVIVLMTTLVVSSSLQQALVTCNIVVAPHICIGVMIMTTLTAPWVVQLSLIIRAAVVIVLAGSVPLTCRSSDDGMILS